VLNDTDTTDATPAAGWAVASWNLGAGWGRNRRRRGGARAEVPAGSPPIPIAGSDDVEAQLGPHLRLGRRVKMRGASTAGAPHRVVELGRMPKSSQRRNLV
jgi:hypothetical protein